MAKQLFDLGAELSGELADFCEALFGAPKTRIVKEALSEFFDRRLAEEPILRRRYDAAKRRRLSTGREKIHVVKGGPDGN